MRMRMMMRTRMRTTRTTKCLMTCNYHSFILELFTQPPGHTGRLSHVSWHHTTDPSTPKIWLFICFSDCHTYSVIFVLWFWCFIERICSPIWLFCLFSSTACLRLHWYYKEKLHVEHCWESKDLAAKGCMTFQKWSTWGFQAVCACYDEEEFYTSFINVWKERTGVNNWLKLEKVIRNQLSQNVPSAGDFDTYNEMSATHFIVKITNNKYEVSSAAYCSTHLAYYSKTFWMGCWIKVVTECKNYFHCYLLGKCWYSWT